MMFRCIWNRTVLASLVVGILSSHCVQSGHAAQPTDEPSAKADEQPLPVLNVKITDVDASLDLRKLPDFTLSLIIAVNVENISGDAVTVAREQFQLLVDGTPAEIGSVGSHASFSRSILEPGKTAEGSVGFGSITYDGKEPSIILRWQPPVSETNLNPDVLRRVDINLNEELRRQSDFRISRLGPEDCLWQISTNRNLDVLAIWPAAELLKQAAQENVSRILFSSATDKRPAIHEEFNIWLSSMIDTEAMANDPNLRFTQRLTPPLPKYEIKFQQIFMGGIKEAVNRQYGLYRRPIGVFPDAEAAIAQALTPVYRHVAAEVAVADLQHPNPGVRRAAMAGAVDRLTPKQAEIIIDEALKGSPELQLEVAGYLNLIPGAKSVEALRILSDSADPKISVVALSSLIRSLDPAAESAMTDLWRASHGRPEKQKQILSAIIQLNSERWTSLVAGYVAERFEEAAAGGDANSVAATAAPEPTQAAEADDYDSPDAVIGGLRMAGNQINLMGSALAFLRVQGHVGTLEVLRKNLLGISDPALQDIALSSLVEARDPADDAMLRECLDRRIRMNQISDSIRNAVVQLPSAQWTEILLQDLKSNKALPNPPLAAQAMLRCASSAQLDDIVDSFDALSMPARQQTLRHLAMLGHPRWKPLAKNLIDAPLEHVTTLNPTDRSMSRSLVSETIQLLAIDASEESIAMLTERLTKAVAEIGDTEEIPIENRMFAHSLIEKISMFSHPDCRRCLNRVARCNNKDLQEKAVLQLRTAERRSPATQLWLQRINNPPNNLRRLDDTEETVDFYQECIELDPYLTEMYVRRASVLMHLGRFAETMADLKIASRLSPENMDVESMIALCQIRLGETESGLKYAEELVVMAPRDLSSLYNGACSYSRALENSNVTDDQKKKYGDRAIELIRQTIATEFDDFEHLQSDEDLVAIHTHPEWQAVVDETKKMHDQVMKKPPE